jgi:hypothetical protein
MGEDAVDGDVIGFPAELVGDLGDFFTEAFDLFGGRWVVVPGARAHAGEGEGNGFGVASGCMFLEGLGVWCEFFAGAVAEDDGVVVAGFGPLVVGGGPMEIDFLDELAHGDLDDGRDACHLLYTGMLGVGWCFEVLLQLIFSRAIAFPTLE